MKQITISLEKCVQNEVLSKLFLFDQKKINRIAASMISEGFRADKPIILDAKTYEVVDGHSRWKAARQVGISEIPAYLREFKDDDERIEFALAEQRDRRDLTDSNILKCVQTLIEADYKGIRMIANENEHAYKRIAEKIGCTVYKIQYAKKLLSSNNTDLINEVLTNTEVTLHSAVKRLSNIKVNTQADFTKMALLCIKRSIEIIESKKDVLPELKRSELAEKAQVISGIDLSNVRFPKEINQNIAFGMKWYLVGCDKSMDSCGDVEL